MSAESRPPAQRQLMAMITSFWAARAIYAAASLGVADLLKDGRRSAAEMAETLAVNSDGLHRLLRALTFVGIFDLDERGGFGLTEMGQYLRSDLPTSLRGHSLFHGSAWSWQSWSEILYSVQSGQPAGEHVFGLEMFDYLNERPTEAHAFDQAMTSTSDSFNYPVVSSYDFSGISKLADIGGGRGSFLAAILRANPLMRGLLFEQQATSEGASVALGAQGLADRCEFVVGDFFQSVPGGADAYALKNVLHDWDDARASKILQNVRQAMQPGNRLLIVENMILTENQPSFGMIMDLQMMLVTPSGRERTVAQFSLLLVAAGFQFKRLVPTGSSMNVLEAVAI